MLHDARIYTTPGLMRYVGLLFLLMGLCVWTACFINVIYGDWNVVHFGVGVIFGTIFSFAGWVMHASDCVTVHIATREIVFHERLFRSRETERMAVKGAARLRIEEDPDTEGTCYRLMLDDKVIREEMSEGQAHKVRERIKKLLGLA